jgi:sugar phosphate isomerase/epimerase
MARQVQLELGINGAFLTRRWEQPENWMRLTAELGYPAHEFCGDVLDPFFSGDRDYQMRTADEVKAAAEKYGVHITDIYTGVATHRFHGLSHSDPSCRRRMMQWIYDTMDLALAMGTDRVGGHWDAISVEVMETGDNAYEAAIDRLCDTFVEMAAVGAEKGIGAIYLEQMYIPSEVPWTLRQAEDILIGINRQKPAIPVYVTLDVGHMAGMHYGLEGEDLDYLAWVRRLAGFAEIVHLQQTTPDGSHHWPFTDEFNVRGHICMGALMEALEEGHRTAFESPVSEYLQPVERSFLVAELIPGSTKTETALLEELQISADYLKQWLPEGRLTFDL